MATRDGTHDATEAARLRAELAASDARFRSIIERTADGIVIVGEDRAVRFMNRAAEQLFGHTADELAGHDFGLAVVAGETTEMDIVRHGQAEAVIAELRISDTTWEGEPAQLISLRDVTDRKHAEERAHHLLLEQTAREQAERAERRATFLAEAGARLDASLDQQVTLASLTELIVPRIAEWCVIDLLEDGSVRRIGGRHADPAKQPLLDELHRRYPPMPDSPQPATRVLRTGVPELHRNLDEESLRAMAVDETHLQLLRKLDVRSLVTVPLRARNHLLGVMTIVCTERTLEASDLELVNEVAERAGQAIENARLYEAAVAASKARSDFLAVVSHELRTPLNAILGYTQLLLDGISGSPDDIQTRQLRRIDASAMHLLQIIQKILTFASMEAARVEPAADVVRLGDLMDGIAGMAEPLAVEQGLAFGLHVRDPDTELVTDAGKLRQIILDLLINATKFTDDGRIDVSAELRDEELVIEVSDTGAGIAREHLEKVFEPFWQAEASLTRKRGGTGLGLAVAQRLARVLGGGITATSEPAAGSTFTLRVPARVAAGSAAG